jgi:hypothetical protein
MEWDKLQTINKKIIDPVWARHTAVLKEHRVIFTLTKSNSNSLGYFVFQILEFGNSPNGMVKEKRPLSNNLL